MGRWVTVQEAVRASGVARSTLYLWIEDKRLTTKVGRRGLVLDLGELDQLVRYRETDGRLGGVSRRPDLHLR